MSLGTSGCTKSQPPPIDPELLAAANATGYPEDEPATEPAAAPVDPEKAEKQRDAERTTRQILAQVAQARQLEVTFDVRVDVMDRAGIRAFAEGRIREEMTPEEIALQGRIQSSLGVLPVGADGEKVLLDMLEEGVLGLYDEREKVLYIGDFVPRFSLDMVVGHEIAHGLQDMHFDLEALMKAHEDEPKHIGHADREAAQTFLVEGDAQASYLAWKAGPEGPGAIPSEALHAMADDVLAIREGMIDHPIFARMLQMPYTDGTNTVLAIASSRGWGAVDALYRDLPQTTEQMLHLDKLEAREPARPVVVKANVLAGALADHQVVYEDDMGEAALLAMIADVTSPGAARAAAAGWGGDRFVALERTDGSSEVPTVIALLAWDDKAEAQEFVKSFELYLEQKMPGAFVLERKREQVLLISHPPEGVDRRKLAATAWGGFDVGAAG